MTSAPITSSRALPATTVEESRQPLRLRLKPKAPTTGFVDGGWWPRSRDLAAELSDLLAVLAVRMGPVERVSYHVADWGPTARKISVGDSVIRVGGYGALRADTMDVMSARQRVTLLVVAPETPAQIAHSALMAAGRRGNTDDVETLLGLGPLASPSPAGAGAESDAAAEQGWELDGGRLYARVQPLSNASM